MERKQLVLVRKAREEFKKTWAGRKNNVSNYGLVDETGKFHDLNYSHCHAGLQYNQGVKSPIAVLDGIQHLKVKEEIARRFYEWLFNYSPFESIFQSKSAKTALSHHTMIANTDVPANLMVAGLIAARMTSEYPKIPNIWDAFVNRGLHPNIAFAFAHTLSTEVECQTLTQSNADGHTSIAGTSVYRKKSYSTAFYLNKPVHLMKPYREHQTYDNLHKIWDNEKVKTLKDAPNTIISRTLDEVSRNKKANKNPFAQFEIQSVNFNEGIEALTPAIQAMFKDI